MRPPLGGLAKEVVAERARNMMRSRKDVNNMNLERWGEDMSFLLLTVAVGGL